MALYSRSSNEDCRNRERSALDQILDELTGITVRTDGKYGRNYKSILLQSISKPERKSIQSLRLSSLRASVSALAPKH